MAVDKAEATANVSRGMGWTGWLTVIFVVLKLDPGNHLSSDVENWSWWLVFIFPLLWLGIFALILVGLALGLAVAATIDEINRKVRWKRREKDIAATAGMTADQRHEYNREQILRRNKRFIGRFII